MENVKYTFSQYVVLSPFLVEYLTVRIESLNNALRKQMVTVRNCTVVNDKITISSILIIVFIINKYSVLLTVYICKPFFYMQKINNLLKLLMHIKSINLIIYIYTA